jgi:hypothetical protein
MRGRRREAFPQKRSAEIHVRRRKNVLLLGIV